MKKHNFIFSRRGFPIINAIFFGAFNDNFLKNAIVVWMTFYLYQKVQFDLTLFVTLATALLILPFVLFSGSAGFLGEKIEKGKIIRFLKLLEVFFSIASLLAFYIESINLLLFVIFLMGMQSTIFAPVKYSILPQHFKSDELVKINGIVLLFTFIAILLGSFFGSFLILLENGIYVLTISMLFFSLYSYIISFYIPYSPKPRLHLFKKVSNYNLIGHTKICLKTMKNKKIGRMIHLSSWFWFFSAAVFSQLSIIVERYLHSSNDTYILLLTTFTIGIALGSIFSPMINKNKIHFRFHKFFLLTIAFGFFDLALILFTLKKSQIDQIVPLNELIFDITFLRLLLNFFILSFFCACYIVPIYSFIQNEAAHNEKSLVFGANNIINALYMCVSTLLIILLSFINLELDFVFLLIAVLNLVVIYFFKK